MEFSCLILIFYCNPKIKNLVIENERNLSGNKRIKENAFIVVPTPGRMLPLPYSENKQI